jgi:hypothetical protein
MTVNTSIQVVGVQSALKELHKVNPGLRKEITRDFKNIVKPVIGEAQQRVPTFAPLSGMARSWSTRSGWQIFPYNAGELRKSIVAKISTRRPRPSTLGNEVTAAFRIVFKSPAAMSVDMAGRRGGARTAQGAAMVSGLEKKFGQASRFLWPAFERKRGEVEGEMLKLIERVMREVNQKLQRVG